MEASTLPPVTRSRTLARPQVAAPVTPINIYLGITQTTYINMASSRNTNHGHPQGLLCQLRPQIFQWSSVITWTTYNNMFPTHSRATYISMAVSSSANIGYYHGLRRQHKLHTSTWFSVAAQPKDINANMASGTS